MASLLGYVTGGGDDDDATPAPVSPPSKSLNGRPAAAAKKGSKFRRAPVPLVEVDDDSKFSVNSEAREILQELEGKICVVSVAGLCVP